VAAAQQELTVIDTQKQQAQAALQQAIALRRDLSAGTTQRGERKSYTGTEDA